MPANRPIGRAYLVSWSRLSLRALMKDNLPPISLALPNRRPKCLSRLIFAHLPGSIGYKNRILTDLTALNGINFNVHKRGFGQGLKYRFFCPHVTRTTELDEIIGDQLIQVCSGRSDPRVQQAALKRFYDSMLFIVRQNIGGLTTKLIIPSIWWDGCVGKRHGGVTAHSALSGSSLYSRPFGDHKPLH